MDINVNGQTYAAWEHVPAEWRAKLAASLPDADKNGVPDLFETGALPPGAVTSTAFMVNGQTYHSAAELPENMQALLKQAFGLLQPGQPTSAFVPAAPPTTAPTAPPATPQPGHVVLNGETVSLGQTAAPEKKGFWRRLFGG